MMIIKLFYVLHKIGMFHPSAIYRLGVSVKYFPHIRANLAVR